MSLPQKSPAARAGIQSLETGFALLQALAQAGQPLMLRDLALTAGMPAAKAHRYLVSFQRLQMVVQDPLSSQYDLGPGAWRLGLAALSRLDALRLARQRAPDWAAQLGHPVGLAVWGSHGPTLVHWQAPRLAVPWAPRLGEVMPLLRSAAGQCFATWMPAAVVTPLLRQELARLRRLPRPNQSPYTIPSPHPPHPPAAWPHTLQQARHGLEPVRQRGLACTTDALAPGWVDFCAPVFEVRHGPTVGMALGILTLGPSATLDSTWEGAPATLLCAAARQLSADLGATA